MAIAFNPTTSRGRPGICTSPAEIIVVTPPCKLLSIQPIWFCRGVQSPATGWTWLSIRPGATVVPLASTIVVAPSVLTSLKRPIAVILPFSATIVSPSRIGFSRAPDSSSPILRITSLLGPVAWGASWAMVFPFGSMPSPDILPGLTIGSSWIIHLYTNNRIRMIVPVNPACRSGNSAMSNFNQESVLSVHHWTDTLFSFTTTRDPSFRFRNGEFTMIGLKVGEKPLLRAYSVASANYEDRLEFFSIKVPDGPLTSRLQHLKQGDEIIVSRKATGTLVIDNLEDGRNLYLIGTGTGLAPFLSVIKDPETYERFEKVVLLHGCRRVKELAYGEMITERLPNDELIGECVRNQLVYYPTVTRDPFRNRGRITDLINSGKLFADIGLASLDPAHDRVMICGSPALVTDTRTLLNGKGFVEGNHGEAAQFVVEKAFAER